ncbi:MAG: ATP-binding protein [Solirubrobacteraceae bacterium]
MSHAALEHLAAVVAEDPRLMVARALQAARDVLDMEVAYLAELDEVEQVFRAVGPDGLIAGVDEGRRIPRRQAYCDRLIAGVIPQCVPDTTANPETATLMLTEMGVRSYVGVTIERPDGHVDGTLCCLSRSTDPSVAEQELRFMQVLARLLGDQLQRQAHRQEQDVKREGLAAMAMHDLKTPVTAVLGYAELLEDSAPALSGPQVEHLSRIRRAGRQLSSLADHLLDVSRAEGAPPPVPHGPVDLGKVVAEAIELLAPSVDPACLDLAVESEPGLVVAGDGVSLQRVVQNLIGNAIKYTATGQVDVRVRRDADGIVLEIQDTGCGIPADEQSRVFEPFYRAANGRTGATGSGLGLAVCRQVVAEHGGSLTLESTEGEGTTVSMALLAYRDASE